MSPQPCILYFYWMRNFIVQRKKSRRSIAGTGNFINAPYKLQIGLAYLFSGMDDSSSEIWSIYFLDCCHEHEEGSGKDAESTQVQVITS